VTLQGVYLSEQNCKLGSLVSPQQGFHLGLWLFLNPLLILCY